jgi:dipeptidyl aminopeptidase/acylaminoacyl peptidase
MIDALTFKGPSGNISAEMLLPRTFDKEHDLCKLVILMHGFLGSMKAAPLGFLSRMLVKHGYAVLRFDFDGYGKSEGAQQENTVPKMIEDAKAVWEYASRLPFIDRIILLGHSQGGVVAGMLAGRLEKAGTPPAGLIQLAPASILKEYASKGKFLSVRCNPKNPPETISVYGFKMGREYILSAQTLPIKEESSWYTGPVCLIHGTRDKIVPLRCSKEYDALYRNSELHIIYGTEHVFLFHRHTVRRLVLDYLRQF